MSVFIIASSMLLQSFMSLNNPIQKTYNNPVMQVGWYNPATNNKYNVNNNPEFNVKTNLAKSVTIQGGSLRTWSYRSSAINQVQVVIGSTGRPVEADIALWNGPDNTPIKMQLYIENGYIRPFTCVIETPRGPNTLAITNIGQIEFPIEATTFIENIDYPSYDCISCVKPIQGGALRTYPFDPLVESVQLYINTDGRPLNGRIELLQGPNNNKQIINLYSEDGCDRPFFCILETPGPGNVVKVMNTSPVEFPMSVAVLPYSIDVNRDDDIVIGGNR